MMKLLCNEFKEGNAIFNLLAVYIFKERKHVVYFELLYTLVYLYNKIHMLYSYKIP